MASNHNDGTEQHHRSTFTLIVDERTKERCQYHRENREPFKQTCRFCIGNLQGLLQEVRCKTLEGEDCRIIEHTKERYDPEHLRCEDLLEVRYMELVLRVFLSRGFSDRYELTIEGLIHDGEDEEIE